MTHEKPTPRDPLIRLAVIQGVFEKLAALSTMNLDPQMDTEARRIFGRHLFDVLPRQVTMLDLGGGIQIERDEKTDTMSAIPTEKRVTWQLQEVDEYAARLAKETKQKWESRFPKK